MMVLDHLKHNDPTALAHAFETGVLVRPDRHNLDTLHEDWRIHCARQERPYLEVFREKPGRSCTFVADMSTCVPDRFSPALAQDLATVIADAEAGMAFAKIFQRTSSGFVVTGGKAGDERMVIDLIPLDQADHFIQRLAQVFVWHGLTPNTLSTWFEIPSLGITGPPPR